ncbi:IgGFc-binding protein [Monodelphis domestica]|uniref:IgGFc-binding protein n=1 Tax=Monodelphis domestica TaxID=13616 RepID=UPI0024E23692|nr:IgGFc-binding protein [Monodelphis domestica]
MGAQGNWWAFWAGVSLLLVPVPTTEASCGGATCGPQQRCQVEAGKPVCLAASTATCWAQGDPHYTTFDGRRYDFMGTCSYTISEYCGFDDTLPAFSVEAKNEHRNSKKVSYVGSVTVSAYSQVVTLARGEHGFVRINNQKSRLPVSLHDGRLKVFQSGNQGVIEMDFGLRVTYNWDSQLGVTLPSRFQNEVCGLCGNYNGDPSDDFLTPDETQAANAVEFGQSWKLDDGDQFCSNDCLGGCPSCTPGQTQHYEGGRVCGMLSLAGGPFAHCHDILDPQAFVKDCVYDLCATNGDRPSLCRALNSYATACRELGVSIGDWRTPAGCPMTCPANSLYSPCASACPASCFESSAPSDCASRPCVEGCVCKKGYVLSGDACVPTSDCGCQYQGLVLAPGEEIWGDKVCKQRCVCVGKTQQVQCKDTGGCPAGEYCRVQNGLQGCYPNRFGTCQASGDPHYISFDGHRFDFMGTCVYLLVGSCGQNAALPAFRVLVENEHRGSQVVSYTRAVRVQVHGVEIAVRREHPGKILVDGALRYLPYQAAGGQVQVYQSGYDAVIRTDFGLTITYDWNALVKAKVPISYANALCGLCGNFNEDPKDDFTLRNGTITASALAFGQNWQEEALPGCGAVTPGECPQLDALLAQQLQSKKECGLLKDPAGPFRDCQAKVDPEGYFRDCVYDRCLLPGQPSVGCDNLAAYVAACHAAGATVHSWRSDQFCPLTCPTHSHYEECSRGCPVSCNDVSVPGGCGSECREACVCDDGFALSGQHCVPLAQCGCMFQGAYYSLGESFYPGPGCDSFCKCGEGGVVSCSPSACGPHEACQLVNGALGCVVVGSATCSAAGDPHYTTFDGRKFDYMGTCVYTLVRTCGSQPGLQDFEVLVENVAWGNGAVSVTRMVTVHVAGATLVLEQNKWKVKVNGVAMNFPVVLEGGRAFQHGAEAVIESDFGLRVTYDLVYHVRVTVPGNYHSKLCGLCGNYNGKPEDDFQKPDGQLAGNAAAFGDSWEAAVPGSPCVPVCNPSCPDEPQCKPEQAEAYEQGHYCGFITSAQGPLAACHALVSPAGYFQDCVFDLCLGGGSQDILCNSIHAYVSACQAAGGTVRPWRDDKFCPFKCPPNSHYELCADTCSLGCAALSAPPNCPGTCSEGCQCDVGFVSDGQTCIPIQDCGCYVDGRYYEPNQPVLLHNCTQQCTCHPGQGLLCKDHSCGAGQVCEPSEGLLSCVTKDPCQGVTCLEKETCQVQNGQAVCVPNYQGTCWLWGDPHYHSFDGRDFDFQGTCSYVLAALCGGPSSLPAFTVTTKNENRGSPSVSYVRLVTVSVHGTNISIHKGEIGRVRVNGVLTTLPVSTAGGRLLVTQGPGQAVLDTNFGLRVTYDWNWRVEVTLPSSYHGAVCGLCGNFDGNPANDMAFPNGTQASSIPSWGGSWRVPEWDPFCWDECHGNCPTCDEDKKEHYGGPEFCGPLAPATGGPFSACHAHIKPDNFFTGCVLDVCLGGGSQDILCQALASYAAACQAAGITIGDWRTQAKCPYPCGANSHYELCGPACPPSCPGPNPAPPCSGNCSEGCQCDEGFILSGSVCVAREGGCGCWANGTYHEPGTEFWADASCTSLCRCDPGQGQLLCSPASCGPGLECALLDNGVRGCRPLSSAVCQASGDPHYVSLDGRFFDFQGSCEYLLSGTCADPKPGMEAFSVTVANAHRGNQAVTYTRDVTLHIYGHSLALSSSFPRKLKVDDKLVALPFRLDTRLQAYLSGSDVVLETAFGLTLTFDGNSLARLRVPSPYAGTLCGLCGDYDGDPANDLTPKGGQPGNDPVAFGHSWKVGGSPGCGVCSPSDCPDTCSEKDQAQFGGPEACGVISAAPGPLASCHGLVDPTPFFKNCLLDACQAQGHPSGLCPALAAYVAACQAAGAQLDEWRRPDFCPFSCPANSHYELCGDSCPRSCPDLSAPQGCVSTCREGCVCDAGFVLSGDTCVPVGQCGCLHDGHYYPLGETFFPGADCEHRCECGPGGVVTCRQGSPCGPYEECRLEAGVQACHPTGCGRCLVSSSVHYVTFDGRVFDFHGSCSYVLSRVCQPLPGYEDFAIVLEKDANGDLERLLVTVGDQTVGLGHGLKITVNGELVALPVTAGSVRLTPEGRNVILQTTQGLRILFDGDAHVLLSVPSPYHNHLCGLCGNYNGNWNDDFHLPDGTVTSNVDTFGAAWRVPGYPGDRPCGEGEGAGCCPVCSAEQTAPYESAEACGRLRDPQGPFAPCHAVLSPSEYFRQCVYDLCANRGNSSSLCRSLGTYTADCQAAGVTLKPWRNSRFCPLSCPAHSHYSVCVHGCEASCSGLSGLGFCTTRCFEGCACDQGFLLSQGVCVPIQNCGCVLQGSYLPGNSSLVSSDCSQRCTCAIGGKLNCEAMSCPADTVCQVQGGSRGCKGPVGVCSLSTNLNTFDGLKTQAGSSGIFELSTLCSKNPTNDFWFRVLADFQLCLNGSKPVSQAHIFFQDGLVTLTSTSGVWVNGQQVTLPTKVLTSVSVHKSADGSFQVRQDGGIHVQLSPTGELSITVDEAHAGKLCGACGNFDGDQTNDMDPSGKAALDGWRAKDFSPCFA